MSDWLKCCRRNFLNLLFYKEFAAQCAPAPVVTEDTPDTIEKPFWSLPGFGAGARVETSFGCVPVEALRRGDAVRTRTGHFLKIRHIDQIRLDRRFLLTHPEAQPIAIPQNGMAARVPDQPILVSGGQKIRKPDRFDQTSGRLAADYIGVGNVARKYHGYFTYYMFHCGEPCTINIHGLWADLDAEIAETPEE